MENMSFLTQNTLFSTYLSTYTHLSVSFSKKITHVFFKKASLFLYFFRRFFLTKIKIYIIFSYNFDTIFHSPLVLFFHMCYNIL